MSELGNFPFVFKPNVTAIDRAMREFAASAAWLFEDIIGTFSVGVTLADAA